MGGRSGNFRASESSRGDTLTKVQVVRRLVKTGVVGLPRAIKIYNELSSNGFYEIEKKELNAYIRKNII